MRQNGTHLESHKPSRDDTLVTWRHSALKANNSVSIEHCVNVSANITLWKSPFLNNKHHYKTHSIVENRTLFQHTTQMTTLHLSHRQLTADTIDLFLIKLNRTAIQQTKNWSKLSVINKLATNTMQLWHNYYTSNRHYYTVQQKQPDNFNANIMKIAHFSVVTHSRIWHYKALRCQSQHHHSTMNTFHTRTGHCCTHNSSATQWTQFIIITTTIIIIIILIIVTTV